MRHDTLNALIADVDRLLGEGGAAAARDEKLNRRADAVDQLAATVPALAGVARAVRRVLDPGAGGAGPLLDLLLLTQQLRVALTVADVAGTIDELSPRGPWRTNTPAGELYPLADTLRATARPGVMGVLESLVGREEVGDFRLLDAVLDCLADSHAELNRLLERAAFPTFGPKAFLQLLARYHPRWLADLCKGALARRLDPVRLLVSLLRPPTSEETGRGVVPVLAAIGEPAVLALDDALDDADPVFRFRAAEAIILFAHRTAVRWPALRDALDRILELARGNSAWGPWRQQAAALVKTWNRPSAVTW
jgi:hypothetical protein